MKVAFVTHFFPPEPCAAATRVRSFVDALLAAGNDVTVVTNFPSFPSGRFSDEDRGRTMRVETIGGARVVRLASLVARGLPAARLFHWISSAFAAALYLSVSRERYDAVVVSMPPITLTLPALAGAWRHGAKLVVDVRDVYPDVAIAMGEWKRGGFWARAAELIVRAAYRRADLVVAVTAAGMAQIAARGVDRSRVVLAPNAAEAVPEMHADAAPRTGFTAVYAGNLGLATDVDVLVDAAKQLDGEGISLYVVGDGAKGAHMRARVRDERIGNVEFAGALPRARAMRAVADADVAIVPLRRGINDSVPTKLYDALSLACPVVLVADGEAEREGTALGTVCTPPGDAPALAAALRRIAAMTPGERRAMGEGGQTRVRDRADRARIMTDLVARIATLG